MRYLPAIAALHLLTSAAASVPARASVPVDGAVANPPVPGYKATVPPVIDGVLDDPAWKDAPLIAGFTHDTKPASVETEVRVAYDAKALYFAFTCHDPQAGTIHAQQRKRNGSFYGDDTVSVGIDPRFDKQNAYWFTMNALGTQAEDIPGGSASKVEWRGDWCAAARITPDGWTAEMAIPFSILRYPHGQKTFGLMFSRSLPRLLEESNWPIRTFYYVHDNEARWLDVDAPNIQRKPLVMPYVLGGSGSIKSNSGVDVKYTSQNDVTSLLTIRPDFATIEDVVQTIDFSYNPQSLPDRRPFFTEGGGYYASDFAFYSRAVGQRNEAVPVDEGVKSFGRLGPLTFAGMGVHWDKESDGVGYLRYDPSTRFGVWGGIVTQHNAPYTLEDGQMSPDNTVWHLATHYWKPLAVNGIDANVHYFRSRTAGPGGDGHALSGSIDRYAGDGVLEWHAWYSEISPDYTARLAYLPEIGLRDFGGYVGETREVKKGPLRQVYAGLHVGNTVHWDGSFWHRGINPSFGLSFRNDTGLSAGMDFNDRDQYRDRILNANFNWRESDIYRRGSFFVRYGRQAGGPYWLADVAQGIKLTGKLSGSADFAVVRLDGSEYRLHTHRALLSALYEFSSERSLACRIILGRSRSGYRSSEAEDYTEEELGLENAYLAYRQEVRKGADIFLLVGDPNRRGVRSQIAMKYVVAF